jgi:hypothetical protein
MNVELIGLIPRLVMQTEDGVRHYAVNLVWGRNQAFASFGAFCDLETKFQGRTFLSMEELKAAGVRLVVTAREGLPSCLACLAVDLASLEAMRV